LVINKGAHIAGGDLDERSRMILDEDTKVADVVLGRPAVGEPPLQIGFKYNTDEANSM
jgi:hypothetical protein